MGYARGTYNGAEASVLGTRNGVQSGQGFAGGTASWGIFWDGSTGITGEGWQIKVLNWAGADITSTSENDPAVAVAADAFLDSLNENTSLGYTVWSRLMNDYSLCDLSAQARSNCLVDEAEG